MNPTQSDRADQLRAKLAERADSICRALVASGKQLLIESKKEIDRKSAILMDEAEQVRQAKARALRAKTESAMRGLQNQLQNDLQLLETDLRAGTDKILADAKVRATAAEAALKEREDHMTAETTKFIESLQDSDEEALEKLSETFRAQFWQTLTGKEVP